MMFPDDEETSWASGDELDWLEDKRTGYGKYPFLSWPVSFDTFSEEQTGAVLDMIRFMHDHGRNIHYICPPK